MQRMGLPPRNGNGEDHSHDKDRDSKDKEKDKERKFSSRLAQHFGMSNSNTTQ